MDTQPPFHPFNMTYYDPLHGRQRLSSLQITPPMAGSSQPYVLMPESPTVMSGHPLGAPPVPQFGTPRAMSYVSNRAPANQQFVQQPFANQAPAQPTSTLGTSPAAQYIAATQAASAQAGMAGGEPIIGRTGTFPAAAAHYNQQQSPPYNVQGVPEMVASGGLPVPSMGNPGISTAGAHSYPGTSSQYGYSNQPGTGDYLSPRSSKKKTSKSKVHKKLEKLLAGAPATAIAGHSHNKHSQKRENDPAVPRAQRPPKGSALGFLHPQGHFVPSALDYMIQHFIHGNKERNLAPEGAKTGYLHPGGYFVQMSMEGLIEEFKYTLLDRRRHRKRRHSPHARSTARSVDSHVSSSDDSEYSDSDDSDTSSEHSPHRATSREGTY